MDNHICLLENKMNNCFINSVLQMIVRCNNIIFNDERFNIFINNYNNSKKLNVNELLNIYKKLDNNYTIGNQYDSHECLTYLLDLVYNKNIFEINISNRLEDKSFHFNNYSNLSLYLDLTLQSSINNFFNSQLKPNNNPEYIFLHIKRFTYNNKGYHKNNEPLIVNKLLSFNSYIYEIISYVVHIGSIEIGHYINVSLINGEYYIINDSKYSKNNDETLINYGYIYLLKKVDFCN